MSTSSKRTAIVLGTALVGLGVLAGCSKEEGSGSRGLGQDDILIPICGDLACSEGESFQSCPEDCGGRWVNVGPAPIDKSFSNQVFSTVDVTASGRIPVLAVNPTNHNEVWVGTAAGGVWRSTNATSPEPRWTPMTDHLEPTAIGSIVLDGCTPARCTTAWVGTGENNLRRSTMHGGGLIRIWYFPGSGGDVSIPPRWNAEVLDADYFENSNIIDLKLVGTEMFAAVASGSTFSMTTATALAPAPAVGYGVHKRDMTTGVWTKIVDMVDTIPERPGDYGLPTDMEWVVDRLFVGVSGKGIMINDPVDGWCFINQGATPACTDSDRGLPDATLSGGLPVFDHVEIAPGPGNTVYASIGNCPDRTLAFCTPDIYRSDDAGGSWTEVSATGLDVAFSRYLHLLSVHPTDPETVYYGGLTEQVSTDGGATFAGVLQEQVHGDAQDHVVIPAADLAAQCSSGVTCEPTLNTALDLHYATNDGGIYSGQFDGMVGSWTSANENLPITQLYGLGAGWINSIGKTYISAGAQDQGALFFSGTAKWQLVIPGDGGDGYVGADGRLLFTIQGDWRALVDADSSTLVNVSALATGTDDDRTFLQSIAVTSRGLYFATDRVYFAPDFVPGSTSLSQLMTNAIPVSPKFAGDANFGTNAIRPEINDKDNIITAIGVREGATRAQDEVWVGLYNGRLFRSLTGGCDTFGTCWTEPARHGGMPPNAPVSAITTDGPQTLITFSGFGPEHNLFFFTIDDPATGAGHYNYYLHSTDPGLESGLAAGVPLNVAKAHPTLGHIYVGTDHGLWLLRDGLWTHFTASEGFPTGVPVFDIEFDVAKGRVFAATHGRGVYMQTNEPLVRTMEGWVDGNIWDIPVYGSGFVCGADRCECTIELLRTDSTVCASGTTDGQGSPIFVQRDNVSGHFLTTEKAAIYDNRHVAFACFNGECVGGTPLQNCIGDPSRPLSTVKITCGSQESVFAAINGAPDLERPPSSVLSVDPDPIDLLAARTLAGHTATAGATMSVVPTILSSAANGGERALCQVGVVFDGIATPGQFNEQIASAINASPECVAQGVSAVYEGELPSHPGREDAFGRPGAVRLISDTLVGSQMILGLAAAPGESANMCFDLTELGVAERDLLAIMEMKIVTGPQGADGGSLQIREQSPLGKCTKSITTTPGQSAEQIAEAIEVAFTSGGSARCNRNENPTDITRAAHLDSVTSVSASRLRLCVFDTGVGVTIGPEGVPIDIQDATLPELAVLATGSLDIRDRAQVLELDGSYGKTGNSGSSFTIIGNDSKLGDVFSVAAVTLGDRTQVFGEVESATSITEGADVQIDEGGVAPTDVRLPDLSVFETVFPTPSNGDISLEPDQSMQISPGAYGDVSVKSRSTLELSSGVYFFDSLDVLEPDSQLLLDQSSGPVRVYIRNSFVYRGEISTLSGEFPNFLLVYQGTEDAVLESPFEGTFVAPNALLVVSPNNGLVNRGAFFAHDILIEPDVRIVHVPFGGDITPPSQPTCTDWLKNQDETDIDCGGSCGVCAVGQDCNADQDCQSNNCDAGVCQEPGEELPDGSPCTSDGQCASDNCQAGTCAPEASCTAQSAIDLGPPGHSTTVPANACLRVNDGYPSWWNQRNLSFQNLPTSVTYPVGVSWSSSCTGASGTTTITGHWQSKSFGPTNEDCATLIQLGGNSSEQMTVRYYAQ